MFCYFHLYIHTYLLTYIHTYIHTYIYIYIGGGRLESIVAQAPKAPLLALWPSPWQPSGGCGGPSRARCGGWRAGRYSLGLPPPV